MAGTRLQEFREAAKLSRGERERLEGRPAREGRRVSAQEAAQRAVSVLNQATAAKGVVKADHGKRCGLLTGAEFILDTPSEVPAVWGETGPSRSPARFRQDSSYEGRA